MRKVTLVIDNGEPYPEDHRFYFVEVESRRVKDFELALEISDKREHKILAVAEKVKWRDKSDEPYADDEFLEVLHFSDTTPEKWALLNVNYRRRMLQRWKRRNLPSYWLDTWNKLWLAK